MNFHIRKALSLILSVPILAIISSCSNEQPLLQGHIEVTAPIEIAVIFDYFGDQYVTEIMTDNAGNFTYNTQLPTKRTDVLVYAEGTAYGAYVQSGKTTIMDIHAEKVVFSGDNVAENTFYSEYQKAFYPMLYKPAPDASFVYEEFMNKLNIGRERSLIAAENIKGDEREKALRLVDAYYDKNHLELLKMYSYYGVDSSEVIDRIIDRIDPNAEETRLTGLLPYWYEKSDIYQHSKAIDLNSYYHEQFAGIDSTLTNEGNKKSLYYLLGSMFMMFNPSQADVDAFYSAVAPQLDKAPMIKDALEDIRESMSVKVVDGDPVPCNPILIAPDNSRINLSDILSKGKVVYIDIWATWCKPCCAEIPHMEKLVERFKSNDEVIFVSISTDEKKAAWLRKVEIDNPSWPQYIFDGPSGKQFMNEMSISGIPRFLLIGRDGRFISTDAIRPSSEDIDSIIKAAIAR